MDEYFDVLDIHAEDEVCIFDLDEDVSLSMTPESPTELSIVESPKVQLADKPKQERLDLGLSRMRKRTRSPSPSTEEVTKRPRITDSRGSRRSDRFQDEAPRTRGRSLKRRNRSRSPKGRYNGSKGRSPNFSPQKDRPCPDFFSPRKDRKSPNFSPQKDRRSLNTKPIRTARQEINSPKQSRNMDTSDISENLGNTSSISLDQRLKEIVKSSSPESISPSNQSKKNSKKIKLSVAERKKTAYKTLFQLYTLLSHHDANGRPNGILLAAQDTDWSTDRSLIRYQKQVKEGKTLIPLIKTQLKHLKHCLNIV